MNTPKMKHKLLWTVLAFAVGGGMYYVRNSDREPSSAPSTSVQVSHNSESQGKARALGSSSAIQPAPSTSLVNDGAGGNHAMRLALWSEFVNASSASVFYEKYKNAPPDSTEKFLAEYKVLSCGSLTSIGLEKFQEFAERRRKSLPANPVEDQLNREQIDKHASVCKDYLGQLPASQVQGRMKSLIEQNSAEAKALQLQKRLEEPESAKKYLKEAEKLLSTDNAFVVQAMGQVWSEALKQDQDQFKNSAFKAITPTVAEAAWGMAACELGMDCGRNNEIVFTACVILRNCMAASLHEYFQRYRLSSEQYNQSLRLRDEILASLRQRNYQKLGI